VNPSLDFKHQKMHDALRLVDNRNPSWMGTKLAATAPGSTYTTTGQMKSIGTVSANVTGRCAARLCHLICCSDYLIMCQCGLQLKKIGALTSRSFKVVVNWMLLWGAV
jgi:hypothetical protein